MVSLGSNFLLVQLCCPCSTRRPTPAIGVQILICQNLRNNLQHPNEYIRGVTLRFLCRIREEEILEPLIPSILACLEHRHSYVRRNAVLAINALYKLPKGEHLLQDAPELIEKVGALQLRQRTPTTCVQWLEAAGRGCVQLDKRAPSQCVQGLEVALGVAALLQHEQLQQLQCKRIPRRAVYRLSASSGNWGSPQAVAAIPVSL